jgi:hypothetical protein
MQQQQNAGINSSITSSSSSSEHEQEVQYMMAEARLCSSRTCIEYRIQHRNVTMKNLEMEREIKSIRLKHGLLLGQVTTQGVAATARAAAMGEEAFRLPNGELMTAEKYTERTSILNQTRVALERSETKLRKMLEDNATLTKQKEYDSNEIRRCVLFLLLDLLFVSLIIIIIMLIVVYKKIASRNFSLNSRVQDALKYFQVKCTRKQSRKTPDMLIKSRVCKSFSVNHKKKF